MSTYNDYAQELAALQDFYDSPTVIDEQAARIAALEAENIALATQVMARIDRLEGGLKQELEETRRRLLALIDEWERADCFSSTYACAEQVRAILRGGGGEL